MNDIALKIIALGRIILTRGRWDSRKAKSTRRNFEFGKLLGVSPESIKSVENGRLDLSPALSVAIAARTGIDLLTIVYLNQLRDRGADFYNDFLKSNSDVLREERRLDAYTREAFEARSNAANKSNETVDEFIDSLRPFFAAGVRLAVSRIGVDQLRREVMRVLLKSSVELWEEACNEIELRNKIKTSIMPAKRKSQK